MAIKRYVGLGKETVYGTAVAATRYAEIIASPKPDQGWIIPPSVGSRDSRKRNLGPCRTRGIIGDFPVEPENIIGELLFGVFGSIATTNPTPGVYNHEFYPADTLPSYTIRLGVEQNERVLSGCLIEALTIRFPHNDDVKARAEVFSGFLETAAALGSPTISPLQAFNFPINATSDLSIGGVSKKNIAYDLEITIKNNIPFDRGDLSGRTFGKKRYGQREVTGKLSAYFDDTLEYERFMVGTEFNLVVTCAGPIITSGYYYYLQLNLQKCVYLKDASPDITPINEPLVIGAPFKAFFDPSVNYAAKGGLMNTISGY